MIGLPNATKVAEAAKTASDASLQVIALFNKAVENIDAGIKWLPLVIIVLTIVAIVIMFIVLMVYIFNPNSSGISITISQNMYSSFYLIISIINVFVILYIALPILFTNNVKTVDSEISDVLTDFNNAITVATFPVMIVELIFIVVVVMLITLLLVIVSSLLRTYYAIQCPLDKKVEVLWWGKAVDFVMHLTLVFSFFGYLLLQIYNISMNSAARVNESNMRKIFIITFVYYIIQVLFSGIEYIISDNIISINKSGDTNKVCDGTTDTTSNSHGVILNLVFNVVLCIVIWMLILFIIVIYIQVEVNVKTPNIMELINMISKAFMTLLSGTMTSANIDTFFIRVVEIIKNIIPKNSKNRDIMISMLDAPKLSARAKHIITNIIPKKVRANDITVLGPIKLPADIKSNFKNWFPIKTTKTAKTTTPITYT